MGASVRRLRIGEASASWGTPAVAAGGASVAALLDAFGVVGPSTAAFAVAISLLVLGTFVTVRRYLLAAEPSEHRPSMLLVVAWSGLLAVLLHAELFPGPPVATGRLAPAGPPLALPAESRYELVVEGRFLPASGTRSREATYRLRLELPSGESRDVVGTFRDVWARQRLRRGKRWRAPIEVRHVATIHRVEGGGDRPASLRLVSIDSGLASGLQVDAYVPFSSWVPAATGLLGILLALGLDTTVTGDASVTTLVCIAYAACHCLTRWTGAHPGLRELGASLFVGTLVGAPSAALLRWTAGAVGARRRDD